MGSGHRIAVPGFVCVRRGRDPRSTGCVTGVTSDACDVMSSFRHGLVSSRIVALRYRYSQMSVSTAPPKIGALKRWLLRVAIASLVIQVFYASPVFLASMALRIVFLGDSIPRGIHRVPHPAGDAYLVVDDMDDGYTTLYGPLGIELCKPSGGHEGNGDGECPGLVQDRLMSIPLWSVRWIE